MFWQRLTSDRVTPIGKGEEDRKRETERRQKERDRKTEEGTDTEMAGKRKKE